MLLQKGHALQSDGTILVKQHMPQKDGSFKLDDVFYSKEAYEYAFRDNRYSAKATMHLTLDAEHHNEMLSALEIDTLVEELKVLLRKYKFREPSNQDIKWTIVYN